MQQQNQTEKALSETKKLTLSTENKKVLISETIKLTKSAEHHAKNHTIYTSSQNASPKNMKASNISSAIHHKSSFLNNHLYSPSNRLLKTAEVENNFENHIKKSIVKEKIEKDPSVFKPSLKSYVRPSFMQPNLNQEQINDEKDEANFKKLEYRGQFKQRTQLKKLTNILLQTQQDISKNNNLLSEPHENHENQKEEPQDAYHSHFSRKNKKSYTNIESMLNNQNQEKSHNLGDIDQSNKKSNFTLKLNNLQPQSKLQDHFRTPEKKKSDLPKETYTILIPKDQLTDPNKKSNLSIKNIEFLDENNAFLGSSFNFDQQFFHQIVNFGVQKLDEYYEVMEEIPALRTNEFQAVQLNNSSRASKKYSVLSKYRTLNDDLEDIAQSNVSLDKFLLKINKLWQTFSKNQNLETVDELNEELVQDFTFQNQGNLVIYCFFNLFISLFWIIINDKIVGFSGFFVTRIVTLAIALLFAKVWTKITLKEYHKAYVYLFYFIIFIQILIFTILNPRIEIAMELEFLACYLSFTRYAFIDFRESIFISVGYLILHIIYLYIIYFPFYLMIHSTCIIILFNLASIHIRMRITVDNFNNSRINIIKKKQLNNLIVNLLPNHVNIYI